MVRGINRVRLLGAALLIGAAPASAQTLPPDLPSPAAQAAPPTELSPDEIEMRRRALAARREAARAEFRANNPGAVRRGDGDRARPGSGDQPGAAMNEPADDQDRARSSGDRSRSGEPSAWDDREPQAGRDGFDDPRTASDTRASMPRDRYGDPRAADGGRSLDRADRFGGYPDRTGDDDRDGDRRVGTSATGRRAWSEADDPRYRFGAEWVWDPAFRYDRRWQLRAGGVADGSGAGVPLADVVRFDPIVGRWALTRFDRSDRGALSGADLDRAARALGALADEDDDGRLDDREYREALDQLRRLGTPERGRAYGADER
jgi:hypothetical protein